MWYNDYVKGGEIMDINTITQIISNVGFPIACCIAMFWLNNKSEERQIEEVNSLKDAIYELKTAVLNMVNKDIIDE